MIADCVKPSSFPRKEEVLVNIQKEENMNIAQKTRGIVFKNYSYDEGYIVNELKKLMQEHESTEAFIEFFYKLDGADWIADSYINEKSSLLDKEPYFWIRGLDNENLEILLGLMGWKWDAVVRSMVRES
jgi:hypothetical protein